MIRKVVWQALAFRMSVYVVSQVRVCTSSCTVVHVYTTLKPRVSLEWGYVAELQEFRKHFAQFRSHFAAISHPRLARYGWWGGRQ